MLRHLKLVIALLAVIVGLYILLGDYLFPSKEYANKECAVWVDGAKTEVPCETVHELTCDSVELRIPLPDANALGDQPALLAFGNQSLMLRTEVGNLLPSRNFVFRKVVSTNEFTELPIYPYDRLQPRFFAPEEVAIINRSETLYVTCSCSSVWDESRLSVKVVNAKSALKNSNRPAYLQLNGKNTLPVMQINFDTEILVGRVKAGMRASIVHPGGQPEEHTGKIRIRGHTSRSFPKLNFNLYLDLPTSLGYPQLDEQQRYVLHGPYGDLSLIRNAFTYRLARSMGLKSPDQAVVELAVNTNYLGIYHIFTIPHRDDDDIHGIVQIDREKPGQERFTSLTKQAYTLKSLDETSDTTALINAVYAFENALLEGELPRIEQQAFIDYFILNELAKNVDAYRLSTYFDVIDVADSLVVVPGTVWDFNMAWAITKSNDGHLPVGWVIDYPENASGPWRLLSQLPEFQKRLKKRYAELRESHLRDKLIFALIDEEYQKVQPGLERNMKRYPLYEGAYDWPNFQAPKSPAYEVARIKSWIAERLRWMDEMLLNDRRW